MQTNVVTDGPTSEVVKEPPFTGTAVCEIRSALADVNHGVQSPTVPPAMLIGTDAVDVPVLIATTTTLFAPAQRRTFAGALPDTFTRT